MRRFEQGYHHRPDHETGEAPAARFAWGIADIRFPDPAHLAESLLWREERRADKTGQVSLQGNRYEVGPRLAGRRSQLRNDPFDLSVIQAWREGRRLDDARSYELVRAHDQRVKPVDGGEVALRQTGLSYLDLLLGKHEAEARAALGRIAFHRTKPYKEDESDLSDLLRLHPDPVHPGRRAGGPLGIRTAPGAPGPPPLPRPKPRLRRGHRRGRLREVHGCPRPGRHSGCSPKPRALRLPVRPDPSNLYRDIGPQPGLDPGFITAEARRLAAQALWDAHSAHDRRPPMVIDEAHLLSPAMLEEVRFLTNYDMDPGSPMALCLVGQPELRSKLRLRVSEAISQKVTLRFHVAGLPETRAYIGRHLKVAGVAHVLFSEEAAHLIHQFTKSIPRRINNVATASLPAGFAEQKTLIDEATARKALGEFHDDLGWRYGRDWERRGGCPGAVSYLPPGGHANASRGRPGSVGNDTWWNAAGAGGTGRRGHGHHDRSIPS